MRIYTLAELEEDLKNLEIENDMMTSSERARNEKYYLRQKQFLTDSIIDLQIGPTKRKLRAMIEPFSNRMKPSDWNSFQIKLTACRSIPELIALHNLYKGKLHYKLIAELPELDIAA